MKNNKELIKKCWKEIIVAVENGKKINKLLICLAEMIIVPEKGNKNYTDSTIENKSANLDNIEMLAIDFLLTVLFTVVFFKKLPTYKYIRAGVHECLLSTFQIYIAGEKEKYMYEFDEKTKGLKFKNGIFKFSLNMFNTSFIDKIIEDKEIKPAIKHGFIEYKKLNTDGQQIFLSYIVNRIVKNYTEKDTPTVWVTKG